MSTTPKAPAASALVRHEKFFNRAARQQSRVDPYKLDKDRLSLQRILQTQAGILKRFENGDIPDEEREKFMTYYQLLSTYLIPAAILHLSDYLCVQSEATSKKSGKKRVVRVSIGDSVMMLNDLLEGWAAPKESESEDGVFGRLDTLMAMMNDIGNRWQAFTDEMGTPETGKYFKPDRNATIKAEETSESEVEEDIGVSLEEIEDATKEDAVLKVPDIKK